jgi:arsenate reductase-like glutaredoxin family protein
VEFSGRDFFKERFTADEIARLLGSESPRTIFNFKSTTFKKSGIDDAGLSDADLMSMLAGEPRYFRRPIVVVDGKLLPGTSAKKLGEELGFEVV